MARNDHSGYPLKWFKDQNSARHAYECVICLEVLKDPVQVRNCGHQFCALCIDDILKSDPRCPSCRIEISNAMIFEDQAAKRLIKQLLVNCCNEGCSWQGCLSSLVQSHQNTCKFLISRNNEAHQLKVEQLEEKHDTLLLKVLFLEQKHEGEIKQLKLKHEQDIKDLQLKHQQEKQDIEQLKVKHEKERQNIEEFKLKYEQGMKELQLKFEQVEKRWQQLTEKEKDVSSKEKHQKTALFDDELSEGSDVIKSEQAPEAAVVPKLIKYDRDFLLQFRYKPMCLEKPASLPNHEIVLNTPNMPGEETSSLREGVKFLPSNSRQKKKRGSFSPENQESRNGKQPKEPAKDPYGQPAKSAYVRGIQPGHQVQGTFEAFPPQQPRRFNPEFPATFSTGQLLQSSCQTNQGTSNLNKPKSSKRCGFRPGYVYSDVAENDLYRSTDQRFVSEFASDQVLWTGKFF